MIRKFSSAARKSPTPNWNGPTSQVAVFQSPPGPSTATIGMMKSSTNAFTSVFSAVPITTAIARDMTFCLSRKALKSVNMNGVPEVAWLEISEDNLLIDMLPRMNVLSAAAYHRGHSHRIRVPERGSLPYDQYISCFRGRSIRGTDPGAAGFLTGPDQPGGQARREARRKEVRQAERRGAEKEADPDSVRGDPERRYRAAFQQRLLG